MNSQKGYDKHRQLLKKKRHHFADKGLHSQSYGFSCSHVCMWNLDHKEGWTWKNWCFWTVVLEKTLESPLDCKEIQPVHPKGTQPEYSLEGLMLKLKLQYFSHVIQRTDSFEKTLILGKTEGWRQEEKGTKEDEMIGWHYRLDGQEFEQALGVGDGQGSLASMGSQRIGHDWVTELN